MFSRLVLAATAVFVSIVTPLAAHAVTLQVNCDQPNSKLPTIGAALKIVNTVIGNLGSNTIEVTGACKENITLNAVSNLTLTAKNGASITDASGGTTPVITVTGSTNIGLNGFAIRGGGGAFRAAIACDLNSTCYLSNNNVQITNGLAVAVVQGAYARLDHDVLEQSANGLGVAGGSRATTVGATMRNNTLVGAFFFANSFGLITASTTIENNGTGGIAAREHSSLQVSDTTITGNGGPGVMVFNASEVWFFSVAAGSTISGNGSGVSVGDLSFASFVQPIAVSGNTTQPDILCWGHFSAATNNVGTIGSTNCPP